LRLASSFLLDVSFPAALSQLGHTQSTDTNCGNSCNEEKAFLFGMLHGTARQAERGRAQPQGPILSMLLAPRVVLLMGRMSSRAPLPSHSSAKPHGSALLTAVGRRKLKEKKQQTCFFSFSPCVLQSLQDFQFLFTPISPLGAATTVHPHTGPLPTKKWTTKEKLFISTNDRCTSSTPLWRMGCSCTPSKLGHSSPSGEWALRGEKPPALAAQSGAGGEQGGNLS